MEVIREEEVASLPSTRETLSGGAHGRSETHISTGSRINPRILLLLLRFHRLLEVRRT